MPFGKAYVYDEVPDPDSLSPLTGMPESKTMNVFH